MHEYRTVPTDSTFDKYGANQIVQLVGVDDNEDRFARLAVVDSPTGTDTRRRAWVGRRDDGTASVELRDGEGRSIGSDLQYRV